MLDFKVFQNRSNPQPSNLTPKQTRLMETVETYKKDLPPMVSVVLNSLLPTLGEKMTDEKIDYFVQHTRQLLDYIEHGEELPFTDLGEGESPDDGHEEQI